MLRQTNPEEFRSWLKEPEHQILEFKEAKHQFATQDLERYCAALSNESRLHSSNGAKLILGVTNEKPRRIVGTCAFQNTEYKQTHPIFQKLGIRIDVEPLSFDGNRVLIFHIPPCNPGNPVKANGVYLERHGESVAVMSQQTLQRLLNETAPDFSAQVAQGVQTTDLEESAIDKFRTLLSSSQQNVSYLTMPLDQLLFDLELKTDKGLTHAAIILLAKKQVLSEILPQSEFILEWRQLAEKRTYDFRRVWREPFLKIFDEIWDEIGKRNLVYTYMDGFLRREIPYFDQKSTREAILNAVAHRDYSITTHSIFIEASPKAITITSPGGFLPGITPENVLHKREWRNRRLAEILEKVDLVERSGQGLNLIFERTAREGKGLPSFLGTDTHQVVLEIPAQVKDSHFILFLQRIIDEKQISLTPDHIIELERIREKQMASNPEFKKYFLTHGLVEQVGKTRAAKYILSHRYYEYIHSLGKHTWLTGLSRDKHKELILLHLKKHKKGTSSEFQQGFNLSAIEMRNLLQDLKTEGKILHVGSKRRGYWVLK